VLLDLIFNVIGFGATLPIKGDAACAIKLLFRATESCQNDAAAMPVGNHHFDISQSIW